MPLCQCVQVVTSTNCIIYLYFFIKDKIRLSEKLVRFENLMKKLLWLGEKFCLLCEVRHVRLSQWANQILKLLIKYIKSCKKNIRTLELKLEPADFRMQYVASEQTQSHRFLSDIYRRLQNISGPYYHFKEINKNLTHKAKSLRHLLIIQSLVKNILLMFTLSGSGIILIN